MSLFMLLLTGFYTVKSINAVMSTTSTLNPPTSQPTSTPIFQPVAVSTPSTTNSNSSKPPTLVLMADMDQSATTSDSQAISATSTSTDIVATSNNVGAKTIIITQFAVKDLIIAILIAVVICICCIIICGLFYIRALKKRIERKRSEKASMQPTFEQNASTISEVDISKITRLRIMPLYSNSVRGNTSYNAANSSSPVSPSASVNIRMSEVIGINVVDISPQQSIEGIPEKQDNANNDIKYKHNRNITAESLFGDYKCDGHDAVTSGTPTNGN